MLVHPGTGTVIEFQQHDANQGESFDPTRTGFDHLGFKVDSPESLETWREHFERRGVVHSPIAVMDYGSVLTFKDPDELQFEMFYRENHP